MISSNFNQTLEVIRTTNIDEGFDDTENYSVVITDVCLIDLLNSREVVEKEGKGVVADHLIYTNVINILETDLLRVGNDVFEIYSIHNPNKYNRHLEIKCKKVLKTISVDPDPSGSSS